MENFLKWLEKILEFVKNYGFFNIVKSWILLIIFSFTISLSLNAKKTIHEIIDLTRTIEQEHKTGGENIRKKINPIINGLLDRSIIDMDCDRAFILEGHNGKVNGNGLGFYYVDMSYERCKGNDLEPTYWQYTDMPTSMFPFFNYLDENRYFYGTIEELAKIDAKLSRKLIDDGIKFLIVVNIPKDDNSLHSVGVLGYSYKEVPKKSRNNTRDYMMELRYRLRKLLAATSVSEIENLNFIK